MIKKFFISMLGTIAGIWISFGLLFALIVFAGIAVGISSDGKKTEIKDNSILYLHLSGTYYERPQRPDFLNELTGQDSETNALSTVVAAIRTAATDDKIKGIFIDADGALAGFATRMDIREAISEFRQSGKWVTAYADSYSQGDYYIASVADDIYVNPVGEVDIHGIAVTTTMYKGFLDKIGVKMQVVKVGTYKSAVEPFILENISEANARQQTEFLSSIWGSVVNDIATVRKVKPAKVEYWADSLLATIDPEKYISMKVVTGRAYRHEVISRLKKKTGVKNDDDLRLVTPEEYADGKTLINQKSEKTKIAVLYAEGDIVESGSDGIVGPKVVKEIEKIISDKEIKALILRVNSGGGSAFASEQIWEALERFKETDRPFYVSMGDYAASGGYYISCGADKIFAQPVTLTGSIGIFGLIPDFSGLLHDKLGINENTVQTNPNATFISVTKPLSPYEKAALQRNVSRGYETFVSRVAAGREMHVDSVKAIAEGRVWSGTDAVRIGLVDSLGNLNDAIMALAKDELKAKKFCIVEYPRVKSSFLEMLEELDYSDFTSVLAKNPVSEYERRLNAKAAEILNGNRVQARMPEMTLE